MNEIPGPENDADTDIVPGAEDNAGRMRVLAERAAAAKLEEHEEYFASLKEVERGEVDGIITAPAGELRKEQKKHPKVMNPDT